MPPPMPNPMKRMTANPAKPVARYRPGKPVPEQESSDEEEVSEEEKPQQPQRKPPQARRPPVKRPVAPAPEESDDEDEDEEGFVTEEEDEGPGSGPGIKATQQAQSDSTLRRAPAAQAKTASQEESEEEEGSSEEEDLSEEESSSSEDEAPRRKFQRPTFIRKTDRQTSTPAQTQSTPEASISTSAAAAAADADADAARRLAQADLLIKDKLERDALARAAGKKSWDDDDDVLPESMVDDTDGVDPEAEHAAWKVRELKRLKRDREAMIAREKEIEEIERRRNLTAEEREREDREYLEKRREAEGGAGRQDAAFLARYHHKGAFFQGDEAAEILKRRDVMGARFEDEVSDKSLLPEYMRIRDMTKLGKKGRTRYKDLKGEDTGRFGDEVKRWKGSGGGGGGGGGSRGDTGDFDTRGLDERFLPDDQRGGSAGRGRSGPTGANASAVGERRHGDRYSSRSRGGGERRKRSYSKSRSRSRSRSRSPRRRRKNSPSPYRGHDRDTDSSRRRRAQV